MLHTINKNSFVCIKIDIGGAIKNQIEGKQSTTRTDAMGLTTKAKLARKRQKETLNFISQEQKVAAMFRQEKQ